MSTLAATNLKHASSASNNIVLDTSGNVGIGTSSPSQKLVVSDGTVQVGIFPVSNTAFTGTLTNHPLALVTNSVERMRVDSSGNVGIGTSSPSNKLSIVSSTQYSGITLGNGTYTTVELIGFSATNDEGGIVFRQAGTSKVQILSNGTSFLNGGDLLVGATSTLFPSSHAFVNSGQAVLGLRNSGSTAGKYWQLGPDGGNSFKVYNQSSVGMFMSDGATSWSSSSDERQKNIIEPISNAVAKVNSLRAVIGSYKSDQENKRRSFLIAQDVEQALPEAVTTAPDGFLGVAYTDVIPLLVAAIKEQQTHIATLEARLTALEAK